MTRRIRWIRPHRAAAEAAEAAEVAIFPQMRFLRYSASGDRLAPHVDLRKSDPFACVTTGRSTHTFCLYLTTCASGGETVFMDKLRDPTDPLSDRVGVGPRGDEGVEEGALERLEIRASRDGEVPHYVWVREAARGNGKGVGG